MAVPSSAKRERKPYVMSKPRETWSEQEHNRFVEALQLYIRDWKKIEAHVGTKTAVQIRSHAQKYFQKQVKNGNSAAVPPPRPKRQAGTARNSRRRKRASSSAGAASFAGATPAPDGASASAAAARPRHDVAAAAAAQLASDDDASGSCSGATQNSPTEAGGSGGGVAGATAQQQQQQQPTRKSKRAREQSAAARAAAESEAELAAAEAAVTRAEASGRTEASDQRARPGWLPAAGGQFCDSFTGPAPPAMPPYQPYYPYQSSAWQQMCVGLPRNAPPAAPSDGQDPPNYALLYSFFGSLFDAGCGGVDHEAVMSEMSPETRAWALFCLRNLVANMQSPAWTACHQQQLQLQCTSQNIRQPYDWPHAHGQTFQRETDVQ